MLIAFASDYGLTDEFVGVCKAVMLGLAPDVRILDVSHDIPAHDVRAGALLLVRAVQYLPDDCVVVAVVDPGVGTSRRLVGVEVAGGVLLGPDNGLLAPAVAMAGGARSVVSLDNPDYQLPAPGPTFAGRDVLAPAAGHLAAGVPLAELGDAGRSRPAWSPASCRSPRCATTARSRARCGGSTGSATASSTSTPTSSAQGGAQPGSRVEVQLAGEIRVARWVHTYADAKPSELVLLVDSYGLLALAFDRESAAAALSLRTGSGVTLVPEGAALDLTVRSEP